MKAVRNCLDLRLIAPSTNNSHTTKALVSASNPKKCKSKSSRLSRSQLLRLHDLVINSLSRRPRVDRSSMSGKRHRLKNRLRKRRMLALSNHNWSIITVAPSRPMLAPEKATLRRATTHVQVPVRVGRIEGDS